MSVVRFLVSVGCASSVTSSLLRARTRQPLDPSSSRMSHRSTRLWRRLSSLACSMSSSATPSLGSLSFASSQRTGSSTSAHQPLPTGAPCFLWASALSLVRKNANTHTHECYCLEILLPYPTCLRPTNTSCFPPLLSSRRFPPSRRRERDTVQEPPSPRAHLQDGQIRGGLHDPGSRHQHKARVAQRPVCSGKRGRCPLMPHRTPPSKSSATACLQQPRRAPSVGAPNCT